MYPEVFQGIGKHKYREVKLDIDETVRPVVQAPRRTALPIRLKAEKVIRKYHEQDIIESVEGPTDWLANPVYTAKADPDDIRMNLDMRDANKAIRRNRHVIPTIEELRHDLNGAKIFSVMDQNCGYNQYQLAEGLSRDITAFRTHQGIKKLKRLHFGISVAAEVFQRENEMTFGDIENVKIMYDDFLIFGRTEEEHNLALARVMQRAQDCGLTFGAKKCKFHQQKVTYFGLVFSSEGVSADPNKVSAIRNASQPRSGKEALSFISMAKAIAADFIPDFA